MAVGQNDVRAGGAYVEIGTKSDPLNRGLSDARKRIGQFVTDIGSIGKQLMMVGAVLGAPLLIATQRASSFLEQLSKFRAVFKRQSQAVLQWSTAVAKALGRSEADVIKFTASMQDTFVPLGFANDAAAKLSATVVTLAFDIASFNESADDEALMRLQSAIVGNHETVRRFGIIITETSLAAELLRMGIKGGTQAATEQQKVMARLNIIIAGSKAAQGDALRTANSFANMLKRLSASANDLAVAVGRKLIPALEPFLEMAIDVVERIKEWVKVNGTAIQSFGRMVAVIFGLGTAMLLVSRGLEAAWKVFKTAAILIPVLLLVDALGLIPDRLREIVMGAKVGGRALRDWIQPIREALSKIWQHLKDTGFGIRAFFEMIGSTIVAVFIDVGLRLSGILMNVLERIVSAIPGVGRSMAAGIATETTAIQDSLEAMSEDAWEAAAGGAKNWFKERGAELDILGRGIRDAFSGPETISAVKDLTGKVLPELRTIAESTGGAGGRGRSLLSMAGTFQSWRVAGVAAGGVDKALNDIARNTGDILKQAAEVVRNTRNPVARAGD